MVWPSHWPSHRGSSHVHHLARGHAAQAYAPDSWKQATVTIYRQQVGNSFTKKLDNLPKVERTIWSYSYSLGRNHTNDTYRRSRSANSLLFY